MTWMVAQTQQNAEHEARRNLVAQDLVVYLPLFRLPRNTRGVRRPVPLFPGYIFIAWHDRWRSVNGTRGVVRLLATGDAPSHVHDEYVTALRAREDALGYVTFEDEAPRSVRELRPGDAVYSELTGLTGEFLSRSGRDRCVVLFSLLGRTVRTRVSYSSLRLVA